MTLVLLLACTSKDAGGPADPTASTDDTAPAADGDGDGYAADDCDDADPDVHPGAEEALGDDADGDCDGDPDATTSVSTLDEVDGTLHGLAVAANSDHVYLHVQLDTWHADDGDEVAASWTGVYNDTLGTFTLRWQTGWPDTLTADPPEWTAKPDLHADDDNVVWADAYLYEGERNVQAMVQGTGDIRADGTRIVAEEESGFGDVDLLDLGDGTLVVAGCDPDLGELVLMHGTADQYADVTVAYDYAFAFSAASCSVAGLTGAMIVADPQSVLFDLYSYSDDGGLSYVLEVPGYRGYDLDTLVVGGEQWMADAEGEAGLRLVTPDGDLWWSGADLREVDLAASAGGDMVVGALDDGGAPWVVWMEGGALVGASLAGTFPHADDIGVTWTPDGDLLVAIAEADVVEWARWRVPG